MVSLDIWRDKLPEDKAKYYNKTRMSIELFARKLGTSYQLLLLELKRYGYRYDAQKRMIEKNIVLTRIRGR